MLGYDKSLFDERDRICETDEEREEVPEDGDKKAVITTCSQDK